jgi:RNA polymerase sigma factor for flagellar operon FliA
MASNSPKQRRKELWRTYKETGSPEDREVLIESYQRIARASVKRIAKGKLPHYIERKDLVNNAMIRIINAIDTFDDEKGTELETYAIIKAKGAILDELLGNTSELRQQRKQRKERRDARNGVLAVNKVRSVPRTISIDKPRTEVGQGLRDRIKDETEDKRDIKGEVNYAVNLLDENLKSLARDYFWRELTLKQIGESQNLTESRISKLKNKDLLPALRARLAPRLDYSTS